MNAPTNAVATVERRSVTISMSERYGMEPQAFERTVRATCGAEKATTEQFAAFLLVAKEYGLNPLTKEVYAFPTRSGGIQPIVSVDGWANLINSHSAFDGMTFVDHFDDGGKLSAITCRMFRKDRSHPIEATEYMTECARATDPWKQWPRRMLRHKAMIQAARYAFGFSGIYDQDEGERLRDAPMPERSPALTRIAAARASQPADTAGEIIDHVSRETAALDRREPVDDAEFTEAPEPAGAGYDGDTAAGGEAEGNGAEGSELSREPVDIDLLERFSTSVMRASSMDGLKTYSGHFWGENGGRPVKGTALHDIAGRIWRQHEARIAGTIDVEGCRAACDQIIGEVA